MVFNKATTAKKAMLKNLKLIRFPDFIERFVYFVRFRKFTPGRKWTGYESIDELLECVRIKKYHPSENWMPSLGYVNALERIAAAIEKELNVYALDQKSAGLKPSLTMQQIQQFDEYHKSVSQRLHALEREFESGETVTLGIGQSL
jgi:hypothetical protein